MKNKRVFRLLTSLLAVVLCTTAFSVTAFAGGGEDFYDPPAETTGAAADDTAEPEDDAEAVELTENGIADLLSMLTGVKVTFSVTEDGIRIDTNGAEDAEPGQTGTVTTNGGRLNVRTGAGLDHTAFTQLSNGTTVAVVGEDGDWLKIILPERIGYVHSDYMTVSETETDTEGGGLSFSLAQREQRDAWKRLSAVPPGKRMDAVCRMINGYMEQQELLEAIRGAIREELAGVSFPKTTTQQEQAGAVDEDVLGFLRALQEGDDTI